MHRQSQTLQTTQEDKHPALAELPNPLLQHYWTRLLATMSSKISMDVANKLFQSKDIAQIELEVILRPPGLQRHSQELLLILARRSYATIIRFATLLQETQVNEIQAIGCKILQDAGKNLGFMDTPIENYYKHIVSWSVCPTVRRLLYR